VPSGDIVAHAIVSTVRSALPAGPQFQVKRLVHEVAAVDDDRLASDEAGVVARNRGESS